MDDDYDEYVPKSQCFVCGEIDDFFEHEQSLQHKCAFALWELKGYRKAVSKDRHGIETVVSTENTLSSGRLKIEINSRFGEYISTLTENEMATQKSGITYKFKVTARKRIILMYSHILLSYSTFTFSDIGGIISSDRHADLQEGASYTVEINFNADTIGEYRMPIAFTFQTGDHKEEFSIVKEMIIIIKSEYHAMDERYSGKSPFTNHEWQQICTLIPPVQSTIPAYNYPIPKEAQNVLRSGLRKWRGISENDSVISDFISTCLMGLTRENYKQFFHYLLWLDETGAQVKIMKYNMEKVTVKLRGNKRDIIELEVPGLAEKRPSLIPGDEVQFRIHDCAVAYCGIVKEVHDKDIWIKQLGPELINAIQRKPSIELDVRFSIGRLSYEREHRAVDLCSFGIKLDLLFPNKENNPPNTKRTIHVTNEGYINRKIVNNEEQKLAISNILNASSGGAPYIVFGPPGTGKTITIVEAIVHIVLKIPDSSILVCAPANAACDMLAVKLSQHFKPSEMIRIHSETADWNSVPEVVKNYSNRTEDTYNKLKGNDIAKYRIVITTLILVGKYVNSYSPSHVFIDEAAQAMEPEALVSVGGMLKYNGLLVLAGDPKQLGPMCNSKPAEDKGLGKSLLERLMELPLYNENNRHFYITKLILNYRNHEQILDLPNRLFYDSELRAVSDEAKNDSINKTILAVNRSKNIRPQAIEFMGVNGRENKEGRSPSYYNLQEIEMVMKYLAELIKANVKPHEIGIVVPYIRQAYRIRGKLRDNLAGVEVGTTEAFQGREKRVIIISTVRAQPSLLLEDRKYNIGFVSNPQRLNVAMTRAISKLIVIGNPHCLSYDDNWLLFIEKCQNLRSYRGCYFVKRDDTRRNEIVKNVKMVRKDEKNENNKNNNKKHGEGRRRR